MKVSIIGGGNLGSSFIQGFLQTKKWKPTNILVCDISQSKISSLKRKFKVRTTSKIKEVLNFSSILILAVEPKDMEDLLSGLDVSQRKLFITVAAGTPTHFLEERLGKISVIRTEQPRLL